MQGRGSKMVWNTQHCMAFSGVAAISRVQMATIHTLLG